MELTPEKKLISIIGIVFYFITFIALAFLTTADPWPVFLGTIPVLLYVAIAIITQLNQIDHRMILVLSAFLLPALFFLIWLSESIPDITKMDGRVLVVMQTMLLILLTGIILLIEKSYRTIEKKKFLKTQKQNIQTKNELEDYVRQLELLRAELEKSERYKAQAEKYDDEMAKHTAKIYELEQEISQQKNVSQKLEIYKERINGYAEKLEQLEHKLTDNKKYKSLAEKYAQKNEEYSDKIHGLQEKLTRTQEELSVTKSTVGNTLRGIEDKCKAINFVIGRVYADRKGGSKEIRQRLHIPSELYNSFSKMRSEHDPEQIPQIIELVRNIYNHLIQLELPEYNLFKTRKEQLPVMRDEEGKSKIIDVLENNDADPVREYFLEAKEICNRLSVYFENELKK
jgi:DNA repair exonuclease SbcCD ATPase subunit